MNNPTLALSFAVGR